MKWIDLTDCWEDGNDLRGSIDCWELIDLLRNYQVLKKRTLLYGVIY